MAHNKLNIYQVFTRLFGNKKTGHVPWGTKEENGLGKFSDFSDLALSEIRKLGMTHVWFTGIPHHAVIADYTNINVQNDHPLVVKGRAGSPYAVKDYYSVNPDLADDPEAGLSEFKQLIQRCHKHNLKVIIDIVPNHVARQYRGLNNPKNVTDFGVNDDASVEYAPDNNFYYIPRQSFVIPNIPSEFEPLGGELHASGHTEFHEAPARWTGNGARTAQPSFDDWYETVKINYGIHPDGSKDFEELPGHYRRLSYQKHYEFWQDKQVPDSWRKFRDIALYWLALGVDGFRYDMAEMVPVEFWSFMNSSIKRLSPDAFLLAEIYQPSLYRDYIELGKMDYLYDKVGLYDTLRAIMRGEQSTSSIDSVQKELFDIEQHMLHFLENHDEQRIASPQFVGKAELAQPAMVVSALMSSAPTMLYFGQEVGEPANEDAGFGKPSRTSIFDYIGVPHHQRWMNVGKFDGGQLTEQEKSLRDFYSKLMNFTLQCKSLVGDFDSLQQANEEQLTEGRDSVYLFTRTAVATKSVECLIVAANFDNENTFDISITIPRELIAKWRLDDGSYTLLDNLGEGPIYKMKVHNGEGRINLQLSPSGSVALTLA
ncbi:alpha-amylase family protein [Vibrio breoganii]|uniref:alpha-amylase family protein n=1 Tax=Vibrio breoganii TaxID=553239 RepID=UPI00080EE201|nr:alpha-amylase family protein [Vibrio breoganii]OCH74993.1 alpha-amylase [Vibrio breoganii]PML28513.1 alpha-amylase [Vibrio breoganii]